MKQASTPKYNINRCLNWDARSDRGYKPGPVARKNGIVAENNFIKPDRTDAPNFSLGAEGRAGM